MHSAVSAQHIVCIHTHSIEVQLRIWLPFCIQFQKDHSRRPTLDTYSIHIYPFRSTCSGVYLYAPGRHLKKMAKCSTE